MNKAELIKEKDKLEEELRAIAMRDERGQWMAKMPDYGEESGENASEVEEYSNRMSLVRELASALSDLEDKIAAA